MSRRGRSRCSSGVRAACAKRNVEQAFGQARTYKQFAHRSYMAVPRDPPVLLKRAKALCLDAGIGLCSLDATQPSSPDFELCFRARTGLPDMLLLNEKLERLRHELWG